LMLEGFDFNSPGIANYLTGKMASLTSYNALRVPPDFFDAAMGRLRDDFLNVALEAVLHPPSPDVQQFSRDQQAAAAVEPAVLEQELTAQTYFERGIQATDFAEKMHFYNEAIRFKPDFA